jgi:hypothetical protein
VAGSAGSGETVVAKSIGKDTNPAAAGSGGGGGGGTRDSAATAAEIGAAAGIDGPVLCAYDDCGGGGTYTGGLGMDAPLDGGAAAVPASAFV